MSDNVISLFEKLKGRIKDPQVNQLLELSKDIDMIMMFYISKGADQAEVAVIIGQRISELIRTLPAHNQEVKDMVIDILNKRVK